MQESDALQDAFFKAAEEGDLSGLTSLLESHPDLLHAKDESGQTALFEAIGENYDCVKMLIDQGIDIHCADASGWTALHEATYNGTLEMIELLLAHGANVHAKDQYGRSPLFWPIADDRADFMKILLDYGADPLLKDHEGNDSFAWAKQGRKGKRITDLLRQYCKGKRESNGMEEKKSAKGYPVVGFSRPGYGFLKCGCFWLAAAFAGYFLEWRLEIAAGFAMLALLCLIAGGVIIHKANLRDRKADKYCPDCRTLLRRVRTFGSDSPGQRWDGVGFYCPRCRAIKKERPGP